MHALGGDLFVKKATLEYHASARYDDRLEVGMKCARVGTSSIVFGGVTGPALPIAGLSINDAGTIGGFYVPGIRRLSAIYAGGVRTDLSGSLFPPENYITSINNSGRLAANTVATGATAALTYFAGTTTIIPTLNTLSFSFQRDYAADVNASGFVVGYSRLTFVPRDIYHAFVFDGTNTFDLNNLIPAGTGWELTSASAINDNGLIVGSGTIGGVSHAFLLTPIPEPSTLAACATLGLGLVTWRLRRRK